jgi:hypothetical protein
MKPATSCRPFGNCGRKLLSACRMP